MLVNIVVTGTAIVAPGVGIGIVTVDKNVGMGVLKG